MNTKREFDVSMTEKVFKSIGNFDDSKQTIIKILNKAQFEHSKGKRNDESYFIMFNISKHYVPFDIGILRIYIKCIPLKPQEAYDCYVLLNSMFPTNKAIKTRLLTIFNTDIYNNFISIKLTKWDKDYLKSISF